MGRIYKKTRERKGFLFSLLLIAFLFFISVQAADSAVRLGSISGMNLPTRVAVDSAGSIYVTDPMMNRLMIYGRDGSFIKAMYGLMSPLGVAVDAGGKIYIGSETKDRVDVYSGTYQYLYSLGKGAGEFKKPNSIAIHTNGTIYVADSDAHMIKMYNSDGSALGTFGKWGSVDGSKDGEFNFPAGLAIDEQAGEIYVTDLAIYVDPVNGPTMGARVQVFDLSGGFKRSFGEYGAGDGKLIRPLGIAYKAGKVYISDVYQCVVQVFDGAGNYIETIYDLANPMAAPIGVAIGGDKRIFIASSGTKTIEIYGEGDYTYLSVSPKELTFKTQEGASPVAQAITIGNTGTGSLDWTAAADTGWLTIDPASGTVAGSGNQTVSAGINPAGLGQGTYTGWITIKTGGAEEKVKISLEVLQPPVLEVAPMSLSFTGQAAGDQPSGQNITINITNDTAGGTTWQATSDSAWLGITPSSGASGALTTAAVSVNTTGLSAGAYSGAITITSATATGSPKTVGVTLNLIAAGNITVKTNLDQAAFSITGPASYTGGGRLWSASDAPEGRYTISFGPVAGYKKPAEQAFTVETGKGATVTAEYKNLKATKKIIAGAGSGQANPAQVKILNTDGTAAGADFIAFANKYGARVAAGDINGDGVEELIVGSGPDAMNPARVKIFNADGTAIQGLEFTAFQTRNGVNVAAGDLDGDGMAEIIVGTGAGRGGSCNVRVFKAEGNTITDTGINFISDPSGNGVNVAAGDLDGDGMAEIITGTATMNMQRAASMVRTWKADVTGGAGKWTITAHSSFSPFGNGNGTSVAAGDLDGDGTEDIIVAEAAHKQRIRAFNGDGTYKGMEIPDTGMGGAVSIASGDTDGDGAAEVIVGAGQTKTSPATVKVYSGSGAFIKGFIAFSQKGGVNVGIGQIE